MRPGGKTAFVAEGRPVVWPLIGKCMLVRCPRCKKETEFEGNPHRPFCSERCKLIDLGNWVSESYRIPTRTKEEEEDGLPETGKGSATS